LGRKEAGVPRAVKTSTALHLACSPRARQLSPMVLPATKSASKANKVMKAKGFSKIATGRFAKVMVFRGKKERTAGGLKADALMINKRGKVVSKRQSAVGKRRYSKIEGWVEALMAAREALHVKGFVAVNGKTLQGKALYVKTKALRAGAGAAPEPDAQAQ